MLIHFVKNANELVEYRCLTATFGVKL